jgi:hypothetical protein
MNVAQYHFGDLFVNVEQYEIAGATCWDFYTIDNVCMSEKIMYQSHLTHEGIPSKDEVRHWLGL